MRKLKPLVEPRLDEVPLHGDVADRLEASGVGRTAAEWIAEKIAELAYQHIDPATPGTQRDWAVAAFVERALCHLDPILKARMTAGALLVNAMYRLAHLRSYADVPGIDEAAEQRVFERLLRIACDVTPPIRFSHALEEMEPKERRPDLDRLGFELLVRMGRLTDDEVAELPRVRSRSLHDLWAFFNRDSPFSEGIELWFSMEPYRTYRTTRRGGAQPPDPAPQDFIEWIPLIERWLARKPDDLSLLGSLWIVALNANGPALDAETRLRVLDRAMSRLAYLRNDDITCSGDRKPERTGYAEHDRDAFDVVARLGGHWKAVKSALLLLRALREPAVSADLRYWLEPRDCEGRMPGAPPTERMWIPDCLATLMHEYATEERFNDRELLRFRQEFAKFCLDRLRSRHENPELPITSDGAMLEPYPEWRRCYIRAVRELRVNPGGRGHHVLYWLSRNDPHPELRGEAATAYGEMIKDTRLAPGVTPRRALFAAFWYLRQGHLQALGRPVDAAGANRTRRKETQRVKEVERDLT